MKTAYAHEIYVLDPDLVEHATTSPSPNPFLAFPAHASFFVGCGFTFVVLFGVSLWLSLSKKVTRVCTPFLLALKPYALSVLSIGVLISLIFNDQYGMEILPAFIGALAGLFFHRKIYAFFLMRLGFAVSVLYSALDAKLFHSNLALETIRVYDLTQHMHMLPMVIVLSAFCVEMLIGLCILLGVQLRLVAVIFTGFLLTSLQFFGEAAAPHLILFTLNAVLFLHGYDRFTVLKNFVDESSEPVL